MSVNTQSQLPVDELVPATDDQRLKSGLIAMWPLPVVGALLGMLAVRFLITPDGSGYLGSAQALFSEQMAEQYRFVREPGLPLLLKFVTLSPVGDNLLFGLVQGLMAGIAVAAMGGVFYDIGRDWQRLSAGFVALTAATYINYVGMVAQQIGMAMLLALMGLTLRWIQSSRTLRSRRILVLAGFGVLGIYWIYAFAYLLAALAVLVAVLVVLSCAKSRPPFSQWVALLLAAAGVLVIPLLCYQPWANYRAQYLDPGLALGPTVLRDMVAEYDRYGAGGVAQDRLGATLALLQLRDLAVSPLASVDRVPPPSEDAIWTNFATAFPHPECGILDLDPVTATAVAKGVDITCQPVNISGFWGALAVPTLKVGGVASVVFVGVTLWAAMRRRKLFVVLLAPWAWVGIYAVSGGSHAIDRYAIPIWPFKATLLVLLVIMGATWAVEQVQQRVRGRDIMAP